MGEGLEGRTGLRLGGEISGRAARAPTAQNPQRGWDPRRNVLTDSHNG
jgi:hypothetical protein